MLDPKTQIILLTKNVNHYRDLYYNEHVSEIADEEYDILLEKLRAMEETYNFRMAKSPTRITGYSADTHLTNKAHKTPILAVESTRNFEDIPRILGREELIFMPHITGATVRLTYENGGLIEAVTKGNGKIGKDITGNARYFLDVPAHIKTRRRTSVIGRVFITEEDFQKQNEDLPEEDRFANTKEYVETYLTAETPGMCADKCLTFTATLPMENIFGETLEENFQYMEKIGIPHVPFLKYEKMGWKDQEWYDLAIEEMQYAASEKGWNIDGITVRYNDLSLNTQRDEKAKFYKNAITYKFEEAAATTTVTDIQWQVERNGTLTPHVFLQPTELDDITVEEVRLNTYREIRKWKLGVGDTVEIGTDERGFPAITKNLTKSDKYVMITTCPECGNILERREDDTHSYTTCPNEVCPGRRLGKFMNLVREECLDIPEFTKPVLKALIKTGCLHDLVDIFGLHEHRHELFTWAGLGKKADEILEILPQKRECSMECYLRILNIPGITEQEIQCICNDCSGMIDHFISRIVQRFPWSVLSGISYTTERNIYQYFLDSENLREAKEFAFNIFTKRAAVIQTLNGDSTENDPENTQKNVGNVTAFTGKNVAISGTFDVPKSQVQQELTEAGAKIQSRVAANTRYMICDQRRDTVDVRRAHNMRIEILSYAEMQEKLKGNENENE